VMEHALGKAERLKKRDFRSAKWVKSGKTSHFLLFTSTNEYSMRRFGVVVSRRIKGAVRRNRIKRLLREFFRLNKGLFLGRANYSVRVTKMPSSVTWDVISGELRLLATRAVNE